MKRINLIACDNGFGLSRHIRLLTQALQEAGFEVTASLIRRGKLRKWLRPWWIRAGVLWFRVRGRTLPGDYAANLMIEHIRPEYLPLARVNVFAPHPEWCLPTDVALLPRTDLVLCMTHHAEPIFSALGKRTAFIGFTSENRYDPTIVRERAFFHLAGRSQNKGTETLLAVWRKHPHWPRLTVLQSPRTAQSGAVAANIVHRIDYIDDAELQRLQNSHRFHICSSETEGFGHYLVEAMAAAAVVLATDAPPMNEMITPERGIPIAFERTGTQHLATTYFVSELAIVAAVEQALALSEAQADALGAAARLWFLENHRGFSARVAAALAMVI